jgi:hypothetical protein
MVPRRCFQDIRRRAGHCNQHWLLEDLPGRHGGPQGDHRPDGSDAWVPAKPQRDETLIRALARAHRWKRMPEEGTYRSAAEIAEAESVTRSFINRMLRLTLLAPDIVEAIPEGRQSKGLQLEELTRSLPSKWEKQRRSWNAASRIRRRYLIRRLGG